MIRREQDVYEYEAVKNDNPLQLQRMCQTPERKYSFCDGFLLEEKSVNCSQCNNHAYGQSQISHNF